jgi:protocatechuate 3,4-dioxygenase beta subunit
MVDDIAKSSVTRRHSLSVLAAAGAAAFPFGAQAQPAAAARLLPGANVCVLTPQAVEGPFYFDPKLERADITEGKAGVPLALVLQVVQAGDCAPLKGARVDVWHADALGYYSGYPGQSDARNVSTAGQHFLRGTQFTNEAGQVTFSTVYPGWYEGRTAHIHCKVFLDDKTVLTAQVYFPDALSEFIYKNVKPYNTRAHERDTVNATDNLVNTNDPGYASFCSIKEEANRYLASLIIGVDRDAKESAGFRRGPPPSGGPRPRGSAPRAAAKGSLVPGVVKSE